VYEGRFTGKQLHSSGYRNLDDIEGHRVLVVGAGNSGCDMVVDAANARLDAHISVRRGQMFQPKAIFGKPRAELRWLARLPGVVQERVIRALVDIVVGPTSAYRGLPEPATRNLDKQPPVVNNLLPDISGVGVVVNAAGIYPPTTLADYDDETYRHIFDVNVLGTLNVIAETRSALRAAGGGAVINFASIDAFAVSRGQLIYSASKAAIVSVTRSLAVELGDDNITVNAVAPGWVDTPGTRAGGRMADAVATIPLRRAAQPQEVADWVWKLAQGTYMTGETIVIAGGLIVR
jgi:NAD(P)-dependent dehydrogenase (short-subunit alcohol dehydrogenase family)